MLCFQFSLQDKMAYRDVVNVVLPMLKYPGTTAQLGSVALLAISMVTFSYIQAVVQTLLRRLVCLLGWDCKSNSELSRRNNSKPIQCSYRFIRYTRSPGIEPDAPLGPYSLHEIIEKIN